MIFSQIIYVFILLRVVHYVIQMVFEFIKKSENHTQSMFSHSISVSFRSSYKPNAFFFCKIDINILQPCTDSANKLQVCCFFQKRSVKRETTSNDQPFIMMDLFFNFRFATKKFILLQSNFQQCKKVTSKKSEIKSYIMPRN